MTERMPADEDNYWMAMAILDPLLKAHWQWYQRGQSGAGRIVLDNENLAGVSVSGLRGAKLTHCDVSSARMPVALMANIELKLCNFDNGVLTSSTWNQASLENTSFRHTNLGLGQFVSVLIQGGDWTSAYIERATWKDARVRDAVFVETNLIDSRFDDSNFSNCNFRDANLSRKETTLDLARCPNTRFIDCDFRGANLTGLRLNNTTFERCKFHGIIGLPVIEGPVTITDADFSPNADGSDLRDVATVTKLWSTPST